MLARSGRIIATVIRILVACASVFGIWSSVELMRADSLFHQDTAGSLRGALQLEPDAWEYYMRLAQLDGGNSAKSLSTALRLNPFNAQADIELGLHAEAAGDPAMAEKLLRQAFAVDRTYIPRWTLAGFFLRQGNIDAFWRWAHKAAEMPAEDMGSLFDLCWRVSPHSDKIAEEILDQRTGPAQPDLLLQYLKFLLRKNQLAGISPIAQRLVRSGTPSADLSILFPLMNRMLGDGRDIDEASALWHSLIQAKWVDGPDSVPYDGSFSRDPLPVGFDWALPTYTGIRSWSLRPNLEVELTGEEPEECSIAEQAIVLAAGTYRMDYTFRTTGIPPATGIRWQILDYRSGAIIAESPYLSSETQLHGGFSFSVRQTSKLLRLRLLYKRVPGTPRIAGSLLISQSEVRPS